jgi:hypothetical protein
MRSRIAASTAFEIVRVISAHVADGHRRGGNRVVNAASIGQRPVQLHRAGGFRQVAQLQQLVRQFVQGIAPLVGRIAGVRCAPGHGEHRELDARGSEADALVLARTRERQHYVVLGAELRQQIALGQRTDLLVRAHHDRDHVVAVDAQRLQHRQRMEDDGDAVLSSAMPRP